MTSYALPHFLQYDPQSQRYVLAGRELHCGDCFQVHYNDKWEDVRIELSGHNYRTGWYLVGLAGVTDLDGIEARWQ